MRRPEYCGTIFHDGITYHVCRSVGSGAQQVWIERPNDDQFGKLFCDDAGGAVNGEHAIQIGKAALQLHYPTDHVPKWGKTIKKSTPTGVLIEIENVTGKRVAFQAIHVPASMSATNFGISWTVKRPSEGRDENGEIMYHEPKHTYHATIDPFKKENWLGKINGPAINVDRYPTGFQMYFTVNCSEVVDTVVEYAIEQ